jgi:hypothetical protein
MVNIGLLWRGFLIIVLGIYTLYWVMESIRSKSRELQVRNVIHAGMSAAVTQIALDVWFGD